MPDWRSGSAAVLHTEGQWFESAIGHTLRGPLHFFIMTKRLMTDRDHLSALISAVENLSQNADVQYSIFSNPDFQRLLRAAKRARQDLYPES